MPGVLRLAAIFKWPNPKGLSIPGTMPGMKTAFGLHEASLIAGKAIEESAAIGGMRPCLNQPSDPLPCPDDDV